MLAGQTKLGCKDKVSVFFTKAWKELKIK